MSLAENLCAARAAAGLSQQQVAAVVGVHRTALSDIEQALARLEKVTSDLHGYLEQRAKELAQPWIEKVEEAANARVRQAEAELRQSNDLVAELRRQVRDALRGQARALHTTGQRHDKEYCDLCKTETVVTLR